MRRAWTFDCNEIDVKLQSKTSRSSGRLDSRCLQKAIVKVGGYLIISLPVRESKDDCMSIICLGGRTEGPAEAWDLVNAFLEAEFIREARFLCRLAKVTVLEQCGKEDMSA